MHLRAVKEILQPGFLGVISTRQVIPVKLDPAARKCCRCFCGFGKVVPSRFTTCDDDRLSVSSVLKLKLLFDSDCWIVFWTLAVAVSTKI